MEKVTVDDLDAWTPAEGASGHGLTEPLGLGNVAINHYCLDPGARISGLHAHGDQEEVFLVVEGSVTFETYVPDRGAGGARGETASAGGEVTVDQGEAIRFGPGEYQSAKNDTDAAVGVYALGASQGTEDVRVPLACPVCGHDHVRPTVGEDGASPVLRCPDCEGESPVECPDCGGDDMTARLGDDVTTPVSACRDCGFESATL
jgi:mannose-6-phosphate isomerase-like protein (cupin superfamily)/transcription elongation factor Elf1